MGHICTELYRWTKELVCLGWCCKASSIFWEQDYTQSVVYDSSQSMTADKADFTCQARIPERLQPGRFDVWGSSHQIFHVLILLAAMSQLIGLLTAFHHSRTSICEKRWAIERCGVQWPKEIQIQYLETHKRGHLFTWISIERVIVLPQVDALNAERLLRNTASRVNEACEASQVGRHGAETWSSIQGRCDAWINGWWKPWGYMEYRPENLPVSLHLGFDLLENGGRLSWFSWHGGWESIRFDFQPKLWKVQFCSNHVDDSWYAYGFLQQNRPMCEFGTLEVDAG